MSVTGNQIFYRALRYAGVLLAPQRGGSQSELLDAQAEYNSMIDFWATDGMLVFYKKQEDFTLVVNQQTYTIGRAVDGSGNPTANWVTDRPVRLDRASIIYNPGAQQVLIPCAILTQEQYQSVAVLWPRTTLTWELYYEPTPGNGTIRFSMIPSSANGFRMYNWSQLGAITDASASFELAQGYQAALELNLAVRLNSIFPRANMKPWVPVAAEKTLRQLRSLNWTPLNAASDGAVTGKGSGYNIYSDQVTPWR